MVRPRSEEAHEKVIDAAQALFGMRGIESTSMDAIARESGVSKATIYKHWADKEALLMEVMCHLHGLDEQREDVDTGDLQQDIATVLSRKPPARLEEARTRLVPAFIAYSAFHPQFGAAWRHRVMDPPRQCLRRILERGIERGLLPPALDMDVSAALLLGPLLYWHIFAKGKTPDPSSRQIGPEIAESLCRAFLTHPPAVPQKRNSARSAGTRRR